MARKSIWWLKPCGSSKRHWTDNAAMIAVGRVQYHAGNFLPLSLNAEAYLPLM